MGRPNSKKVVYLTGAPAAGKSTLLHGLARMRSDVKVFEYGHAMSEWLSGREHVRRPVSQEELRGGTEDHVGEADIDSVDAEMVAWVQRHRSESHLIIDSHHVTLESYGFRIAPFSRTKLEALRLDEVWLLAVDSQRTLERIQRDPRGRRQPTLFQADFHTYAQASLASQYAVLSSCPTFVFDSSVGESDLLAAVVARFE